MKRPIKGIDDNIILTEYQKSFLKEFSKSDLKDVYRLTGGTALSAFYLEHRFSEDLDFFSSEKIPFYIPEEFLKSLPFVKEITHTRLFDRNIFTIILADDAILKVEFTYYPLKNIEPPAQVNGILIDSFIDIVVNKLCTIADRVEAKDYVDLYYAIKKTGINLEDLILLAEEKCEIKGIRYILQSRLIILPEGIERLPLSVEVKPEEMERFFTVEIKKIIQKTLNLN